VVGLGWSIRSIPVDSGNLGWKLAAAGWRLCFGDMQMAGAGARGPGREGGHHGAVGFVEWNCELGSVAGGGLPKSRQAAFLWRYTPFGYGTDGG